MKNYPARRVNLNSCPAEPRFILFENSVDPDQLASDEAI